MRRRSSRRARKKQSGRRMRAGLCCAAQTGLALLVGRTTGSLRHATSVTAESAGMWQTVQTHQPQVITSHGAHQPPIHKTAIRPTFYVQQLASLCPRPD